MGDFDFNLFLIENDYQEETIRKQSGEIFCTNYQKEIRENCWNCITVHADKTVSACTAQNDLFLIKGKIPQSEKEAKDLLTKSEIFNL